MEAYKTDVQKQINNYSVIQSELTQLKSNAKVYKKQDNSDVFFLSSKETELHSCKETLNSLAQKYKDMEKSKPQK